MALPPGFIDELRSRISLSGLIGRRVKLASPRARVCRAVSVPPRKDAVLLCGRGQVLFHCFGCGAHGDAIGFVMRADNLDFIAAVEKLAGEAGLAVPQATPQERERRAASKTLFEALEAAAAFYEARLWGPAGARARDYLRGRGLDPETIRRFRLGLGARRPAGAASQPRRRFSRGVADRSGVAPATGTLVNPSIIFVAASCSRSAIEPVGSSRSAAGCSATQSPNT